MIIWVIKMLLKFMKPIAKIAIMAGLLDTLFDAGNEEEQPEQTEEPVSEEG